MNKYYEISHSKNELLIKIIICFNLFVLKVAEQDFDAVHIWVCSGSGIFFSEPAPALASAPKNIKLFQFLELLELAQKRLCTI